MRQLHSAWLAIALLTSAACADSVLIPAGAVWRYQDNVTDAGTAWRAPGFVDSAWSNGPAQLGYGDGDEATTLSYGTNPSSKRIAYYFRRTFVVTNAAQFPLVRMRLLRDDGAVVYANGTEVWRDTMPAGTITTGTLALTQHGTPQESTFIQQSVATAGWLLEGTNVLACEIHQGGLDSSDISFDFELTGLTGVSVTRGPYLQQLSSAGVVVRWRTDAATNSVVIYGPSGGSALLTNTITGSRTEHIVALAGLAPDTRYDYGVGMSSAILAGALPGFHFLTAPPAGTPKPVRFWVLGDSGTSDANAAAVRNAYTAWAGTRAADVVLMLGDNAYSSGTDAQYQTAVFDMYSNTLRNTVLWPTFGNHDGGSANSAAETGAYYDIFTLPRQGEAGGAASGTEAYYSFDHGNIHFICLNSYDISRATNGAMMVWLKDDLAATSQHWIIAFWHHPPYTKGSHNSDSEVEPIQMRQNFLPVLEDAGVDLVLCGHSHSYERSFFLRGHHGLSGTFTPSMVRIPGGGRADRDGVYDKGATNGAVFAVAGSSGQISGGALNHPAMFVSLNELGSMVLDVNTNRLDAYFITPTNVVQDYFTIVKGEPTWTVSVAIEGRGAVAPATGRYLPDRAVGLTATPSNYYTFGHWGGDVSSASNPVSILATTDKAVTAVFDAVLVTNGVPQWWLAGAGLGTNDAAALSNADHDAMATWQEYIADTDPADASSFFVVRAVTNDSGTALYFPASTQRVYSLEAAGPPFTGVWQVMEGQAEVPGTGAGMSLSDTNPVPVSRAFRVRVGLP